MAANIIHFSLKINRLSIIFYKSFKKTLLFLNNLQFRVSYQLFQLLQQFNAAPIEIGSGFFYCQNCVNIRGGAVASVVVPGGAILFAKASAATRNRPSWRITDLPFLTPKRDWLPKVDMINLILFAYLGMEETAQGAAMLEIGLLNGIIEENEGKYRIKPANEPVLSE